ncbi:hypothetical protein CTAM01_01994 [Colletotrichum tamarilloi]|uniref:Uncharacterized protein n=1 Tax=Colletotrichum tamarilloi TaxID=1209934 RepID=A0ABQ9RQ47_9PEZI|nr:uncharacterized protein CTAM01_01994 [Colletotrichum tamarilloi]KAK1509871.1 hypothetical protein CTAM01_01994 [Colletotrichum tamarilloi]
MGRCIWVLPIFDGRILTDTAALVGDGFSSSVKALGLLRWFAVEGISLSGANSLLIVREQGGLVPFTFFQPPQTQPAPKDGISQPLRLIARRRGWYVCGRQSSLYSICPAVDFTSETGSASMPRPQICACARALRKPSSAGRNAVVHLPHLSQSPSTIPRRRRT